MLFSLISMNNTSFKLFYLLSVLWKTRPRKEIQASRQNIILIAQTWLKAEKYFKSRENHKKKTKPPNQKPKKKTPKTQKTKNQSKKRMFCQVLAMNKVEILSSGGQTNRIWSLLEMRTRCTERRGTMFEPGHCEFLSWESGTKQKFHEIRLNFGLK